MSDRVDSRKRSREDEGSNDYMPLSKRINNLHLTNGDPGGCPRGPRPGPSSAPTAEALMTDGRYKATNGFANHHAPPQNNLNQNYLQQDSSTIYDPELSQADNPHYYQRNKLLYELHFIRSRRCHSDNV